MIGKVYENDNYENQQIFHDIEHTKKYSNYSLELNQTFGDKSYEKFYKNLIEHKKARGLNFYSMFQKPKNATGLKVYEEPFNINEFKSALKAMKIKNDKLLYRIKNPYTTRYKYKSAQKNKEEKEVKEDKETKEEKKNEKENKSVKIIKINSLQNQRKGNRKQNGNLYLPEVPDVGRYRPSYNVLDKHTYQVAFSQKTFEDFNKKGAKQNSRNIFNEHAKIDYNYNDQPLTLEMEKKLFKRSKIKPIFIDTINNMSNLSKTYNKIEQFHNDSKINNNLSNHYDTSSLFNSINLKSSKNSNLNHNNSKNIEINNSTMNNTKSNIIPDSPILIRTNGDIHSRCPKHINNLNINDYLYNTNSTLSMNDSLNNTDSFNNSNSNINSSPKNNHCLKFETYSNRKPIIRKFNYINEDFINSEAYNSVYPAKNKNICIEFGKLSTAKDKQKCFFEYEANKNKNPPLGTYYPKFSHAFKKIIDVYIDKKAPPKNNKRKLKEIILRYDVPSNYLLFDVLNKK